MPDMLAPLYRIPRAEPLVRKLEEQGIIIRRANPWEFTAVRTFITEHFSVGWADEASPGLSSQPVRTWLALSDGQIVGFASYDCTRLGFFGPTGVQEAHRKKGIGAALLLVCLEAQREMGYGYSIIGGAGPTQFYSKACGATIIPESVPGVYTHLLKRR